MAKDLTSLILRPETVVSDRENAPVHGFGGLVLEPEDEVDVVVGVLGQDVAGELRGASENSLEVLDGNCKVETEKRLLLKRQFVATRSFISVERIGGSNYGAEQRYKSSAARKHDKSGLRPRLHGVGALFCPY